MFRKEKAIIIKIPIIYLINNVDKYLYFDLNMKQHFVAYKLKIIY
jgi:hypothetical protein